MTGAPHGPQRPVGTLGVGGLGGDFNKNLGLERVVMFPFIAGGSVSTPPYFLFISNPAIYFYSNMHLYFNRVRRLAWFKKSF